MSSQATPPIRISTVNEAAVRADGDYVLYWMTAARRTTHNFGLQRAVEAATELGVPLVVFEALRCDYQWASERLHRFVIDGMIDNAAACTKAGVRYVPYIEPEVGAGRGLLAALAETACLVVADEFPCFFLPRMLSRAGEQLSVRMEQVDSNGIVPLRTFESEHTTAYSFRRALQKVLFKHIGRRPVPDPLRLASKLGKGDLPAQVFPHWLAHAPAPDSVDLAQLPVDHDVTPVSQKGGAEEGRRVVKRFVSERLQVYGEDRNKPQEVAASGLSPYLHFGHVSPHAVLEAVMKHEDWDPQAVAIGGKGQRAGWWRMNADAEAFLDQLITWRELGYHFCHHRADDYDDYESLPPWALKTLAEHEDDPREHLYDLDQFAAAATHDELWNAAQNQLRREGVIHNYLRMLWGKKILEWTESPRVALDVMTELNNRYALDGRNPNSYSGIFWTLGRFDRAWGERPVFGKIRFMSSANTARKVRVRDYVSTYNEPSLFS